MEAFSRKSFNVPPVSFCAVLSKLYRYIVFKNSEFYMVCYFKKIKGVPSLPPRSLLPTKQSPSIILTIWTFTSISLNSIACFYLRKKNNQPWHRPSNHHPLLHWFLNGSAPLNINTWLIMKATVTMQPTFLQFKWKKTGITNRYWSNWSKTRYIF